MSNETLLTVLQARDTELIEALRVEDVRSETYMTLLNHIAATRGMAETLHQHDDPFRALERPTTGFTPEGASLIAGPAPEPENGTWAPDGSDNTEDVPPTEEKVVPFPKPEPALTKTEVKARLTALANDNGVDVAKVMHELGYQRLSDVPESRYAELLAKAEEAV
jgi:hypothetical protein